MKVLYLCFTLTAVGLCADRTTIFVDRMDGLEPFVEEAIRNTEVPVEFIEESAHPDLKILLGKQFTSVHAEVLYQKNTGRRPGGILKAVDVRTGKEIAAQRVELSRTDDDKRRAAQAFARKLAEKLKRSPELSSERAPS